MGDYMLPIPPFTFEPDKSVDFWVWVFQPGCSSRCVLSNQTGYGGIGPVLRLQQQILSLEGLGSRKAALNKNDTLPETNIAHEIPIFPSKYHQNGGFSMAMLVYRSVITKTTTTKTTTTTTTTTTATTTTTTTTLDLM